LETFEVHNFVHHPMLGVTDETLIGPPAAVGEHGVWQLFRDAKQNRLVPIRNLYHDRQRWLALPVLPSRPTDERHAAMVEWAETVAEVRLARPGERSALLQRLSLSKNAFVSAWAVYLLAWNDNQADHDWLGGLHRKALPLRGQVALDDVLERQAGHGWQKSAPRTAFLRTWFTPERFSDADHEMACLAIQRASAQGHVPARAFLECAKTALTARNLPEDHYELWFSTVDSVIDQLRKQELLDPSPFIPFLLDQLVNADRERSQQRAAWALKRVGPLDARGRPRVTLPTRSTRFLPQPNKRLGAVAHELCRHDGYLSF
jgi:hypothetical protein